MEKISSSYFIPRGTKPGSSIFKRVRTMPLYGFPHHRDLNHKEVQNRNRFFIHLDLDCFFAQVEQRDNPRLRGKPVSVGGNGGLKGIVMTASYEARKFGVEIGMSVFQAKQICPGLISLPCYGTKYEAILLNIKENLKKTVPEDCIEQYSIDECFLDITPVVKDYFDATKLAHRIKQMVRKLENLTVSIGLSFNKSYAKLATKFKKPDGLTVIRPENREEVYRLPVSKIWGVGSRIERRLAFMGIFTLGDLASSSIHAVHKEFGINGVILRKIARGEDTSGISQLKQRIEKSFNHHHTLTDPICKPGEAESEIRRITEYICRKMRAKDLIADHLALVIRFDDLGFVGEKIRLSPPTNNQVDLMRAALYIYSRLPRPDAQHRVRMFGMTVYDLFKVDGYNLDLFSRSTLIPYREIDMLKEKYGERIIRVGLDSN